MPAPALALSRGAVAYTITPPVQKNGFAINGSFSQSDVGADWTIAASMTKIVGATIPVNDQGASYSCSAKVPYNEAPSEAAITAKLQAMVDNVFDNLVPAP